MNRDWIVYILLLPVTIGFFLNNQNNYKKNKEIQLNIVEHPELLPTPEIAKLSSFGFMNMFADIYWLQTIQYIGANVIDTEYKKYLGEMMDIITELNPYFESPYTIGQLLLPSSKERFEDYSGKNITQDMLDGRNLWLKWISNFCDDEKIQLIEKEDDLWKITSNEKFTNPCKGYKIPYYLAYIYYFYLKEPHNAALYYKVVAAQDDAPQWAKTLAAIMQGKTGDRQKSLFMFLSLAQSTSNSQDECFVFSQELGNVYSALNSWEILLTGELVKTIENLRLKVFPKMSEENEEELFDTTQCSNYLLKAVREFNLLYLDTADQAYIKKNPEQISAMNPDVLLKNWFINFIPTDYQQYGDYGIIYRYNDEIGRFDSEMSY